MMAAEFIGELDTIDLQLDSVRGWYETLILSSFTISKLLFQLMKCRFNSIHCLLIYCSDRPAEHWALNHIINLLFLLLFDILLYHCLIVLYTYYSAFLTTGCHWYVNLATDLIRILLELESTPWPHITICKSNYFFNQWKWLALNVACQF